MTELRVLASEAEIVAALQAELAAVRARMRAPLISLATGSTFAPLHAALTDLAHVRVTHLDEYLGFAARDPGGMVHELMRGCPALRDHPHFLAVPSSGAPDVLRAHEQRLADAGGVALQMLGIGRNGHIAFNEPGTSFALGFHRAALAEETRADARARFAPREPPREAVTAGPASILAARRVVLVATGARKAVAVRAMLEEEIGPACPASVLRGHRDVVVIVDREAGGLLGER